MNKPELPTPPPMREYHNYKRVNQYKDVDWYTQRGELYDESFLATKLPKTWFAKVFMTEDEKRLEVDSQMLEKIKSKSNYPIGTNFEKSLEKTDSDGKYKYWKVFCSSCNTPCLAHQSDIQRGYVSCECSKLAQTQAYINLVREKGVPLCLKFGISSNYEQRLKLQKYNNIVDIENIGVWTFENRESCRAAENECKQTLSCGIIDRLLMPDGFTETTFLHNLDTIAHIYSKHGGIKY